MIRQNSAAIFYIKFQTNPLGSFRAVIYGLIENQREGPDDDYGCYVFM